MKKTNRAEHTKGYVLGKWAKQVMLFWSFFIAYPKRNEIEMPGWQDSKAETRNIRNIILITFRFSNNTK